MGPGTGLLGMEREGPAILQAALFCLFVCCCCLGPRMQHMEVPRQLGVQSELQLLAYTAATATPDPSRVCNLQHSSRQGCVPDPLGEARG